MIEGNRLSYIIYIDSCAFYPPQRDERKAMEKLFELDENGVIFLGITEATDEEMQKAPNKTRNKLFTRIRSKEPILTEEERVKVTEIRQLLFPNKQTLDSNDERDVRNLFTAQKYGCHMFVTVDKRDILNKASLIAQKLMMEVVSPIQCLRTVLNKIERRKKSKEAKKLDGGKKKIVR